MIQNGVAKEIEWKNVDGLMLPFVDGKAAKLVPGKTWINVSPLGIEEKGTIQETTKNGQEQPWRRVLHANR